MEGWTAARLSVVGVSSEAACVKQADIHCVHCCFHSSSSSSVRIYLSRYKAMLLNKGL